MIFTFAEKKLQISDELKAYAEKKIGKIDRFFKHESEAFITFNFVRGRYIAEVTLSNNGMFYRAVTEQTSDLYAAIDSACSAIERQIRKNKTRLSKRLREGVFEREEPLPVAEASVDGEDDEDADTEPEFKIVRSKRFSIKPMTPEEAILQMNLLGHEFFVFKNQDDDDAFSVVYARKDGGYGVISSSDD